MRIILCLLIWVSAVFADDSAALTALFQKGGIVVIPPGDYHLEAGAPIALASDMSVWAYGARFILPDTLPEKPHLVVFAGKDIANFQWHGGEFLGHVFDPGKERNSWEPNANTKGVEITTTREGGTHDILFRDVKSNGMAAAIIGVHGLCKGEREVIFPAKRVVLENCTLLKSGKFMWDYGYLWQILTFPEAYQAWEVDRARKYFRTDLLKEVSMRGDQIDFNNAITSVAVSKNNEPSQALTFMGSNLPKNLTRGRQYFVVESNPNYIKIADQPDGPPLRFETEGSGTAAFDIFTTYLAAYAPTGSGPGKGAFDITGAIDVRVTGCQLSALGDTMHIQKSNNIIFANNHILGSRMGAFFLAEFCQNATITGNLVDATNGSRVISVEKSCANITMTGNTFRNGGRGAWINQPVNFVMTGNVFVNNTTKNEPDLRRGRIAYQSALPSAFPELYFTIYEPGASYGPVIVRDNIFILGEFAPADAVTFGPNGHDIQFTGNTFQTRATTIAVDPSCTRALIQDNLGATTVTKEVAFNHGRR